MKSTDDRQLVLRNVSFSTGGEFKCQVSGEGPLFATVSREKTLRIAGNILQLEINFSQDNDSLYVFSVTYSSTPDIRIVFVAGTSRRLASYQLYLREIDTPGQISMDCKWERGENTADTNQIYIFSE